MSTALLSSGCEDTSVLTMEEDVVNEQKLADLGEIYHWLKRDAGDMIHDLLDGVALWRSSAQILFIYAVISLGIGTVFVWGSAASFRGYGPIDPLSIFLGLLAAFLYSISVVTALTGLRYREKYIEMRTKYSELYETARKLGQS